MTPRIPRHRYVDPLDAVWLGAAARIGFAVERTSDAYAASDGRGTIRIGTGDVLDPDDCLAQMIFHELCHALVEGEGAWRAPDWGLDNSSDRDVTREHACLRLQAVLTARHGLRRVLAPTTDFRAFYDQLPPDPLVPVDEPSVLAARTALQRAERHPFAPHLEAALAATAAILRAAAPLGPPPHDERGLPLLTAALDPPPTLHPTGLRRPPAGSPAADATCGACVWLAASANGRARCLQAGRPTAASAPACERWEAGPLDCQTCGACCRAAYDSVSVGARERFVLRHPDLVVKRDNYLELRRDGERCAALGGGRLPGERYACRVYDDRPRTCRDFARGGAHCLVARRRVGLSL